MTRILCMWFVVSLLASCVIAQDKYAILVGVESYSGFEPLKYAEDDATALGNALERLGFQTTVMTGQQKNSALKPSTPDKILAVMKNRIASCEKGDTLLISLSGHGIQYADERLMDTGVRESYFCPEDANKDDKSTLIPINEVIIQLMSDCKASRKLLLVDACRDEVLSETARQKGGKQIVLDSVHESRKNVPGGMSVLFSCESKQYSWEVDELGHSVFSYFVIDYFSGFADEKYYEGSNVDLDGLVYFVRKKTNDYVFNKNLSVDGQIPILRGESANWRFGQVRSSDRPTSKDSKTTDANHLSSNKESKKGRRQCYIR